MVHQGHRRPGPGRQRSSRQERMNQTSDDRPQPLDERPEPVRVVVVGAGGMGRAWIRTVLGFPHAHLVGVADVLDGAAARAVEEERSEEHTSELQSRGHLVCRLLLEKTYNTNEKEEPAVSIYRN